MRIWWSVTAMVGLLAVPLLLALASQSLAARPGPPPVPDTPVLVEGGGVPAPSTSPTTPPAPGTVPGPAPAPAPDAPAPDAPAPTGSGPQVVEPSGPGVADPDPEEPDEAEDVDD